MTQSKIETMWVHAQPYMLVITSFHSTVGSSFFSLYIPKRITNIVPIKGVIKIIQENFTINPDRSISMNKVVNVEIIPPMPKCATLSIPPNSLAIFSEIAIISTSQINDKSK